MRGDLRQHVGVLLVEGLVALGAPSADESEHQATGEQRGHGQGMPVVRDEQGAQTAVAYRSRDRVPVEEDRASFLEVADGGPVRQPGKPGLEWQQPPGPAVGGSHRHAA